MLSAFLIFQTVGLNAQALKNDMDSLSYSLGVILGQNLKEQGFSKLNAQALALGVSDLLEKGETSINIDQANAIIKAYLKAEKMKGAAETKSAGEAFLAENAKREGVVTLESGLQYEIIEEGEGPRPGKNNKITTHYRGTLIDGTQFDSSYDRNEPATFPLGQVIQGWQEAIQLMSTGSKWKIYIPYDLAYGEQGAGNSIPPFAALIFEIELLSYD